MAQNHVWRYTLRLFHTFAIFGKYRIFDEKGSQNDAKIDAKIIKNRFWAAKGATHVDLEYFLVVF